MDRFLKPTKKLSARIQKGQRRIAYFSMEIGIDPAVPTYSGGLGVLAGDTIKSFADLNVPAVAVTLLYKHGYFYQEIDESGQQHEVPYHWRPKRFLKQLPAKILVTIENRPVYVQAWMYKVIGIKGFMVPIFFLDTDIPENDEAARSLTYYLYGGDRKHRLAQEIILGIGGVRMLEALKFNRISRYHMNEGHASLLTLELLKRQSGQDKEQDKEYVRRQCVFTTHTPVPAGHDKFDHGLVHEVLGDFINFDELKELGGEENLNMTLLALNLSHYVNGVAKKHGKVSREMFPGYHIDSITNGIHSSTWVSKPFRELYDEYIPEWRSDPSSFRYALSIPKEGLLHVHKEAKKSLINYVNSKTNIGMDYETLTFGFARRATAYKRASLIFRDKERLINIANDAGKMQFIFAGKAHPNDWQGKELIKEIISVSHELKDQVKVVYLDNYDMNLARMLVAGVDVWLNNPLKPKEASGTSGMKAAHNGVPSLSVLDGWWIEGCIENLTGWAIGLAGDIESNDDRDVKSLYDKLEKQVIPAFYNRPEEWINIMRHSIAMNASFFNTHRMVQQYVLQAYLY